MHRLAAGSLLCVAALSSACMNEVIQGSGKVITESRQVSGFKAVTMGGTGQLFVEQGPADSLTITTDDNLLSHIRSDVRGDQLQLGFGDSMTSPSLRPTKGIVYRLTTTSLDELGISGEGSADVKGINTPRFRVGVSGEGTVSAQGKADDVSIGISGSGRFVGDQLKTASARIDVSGEGKALIAVSDRLDVHVSGEATIEYIGNPEVTKTVSGEASVRRVN
jgi:hypothetical protein